MVGENDLKDPVCESFMKLFPTRIEESRSGILIIFAESKSDLSALVLWMRHIYDIFRIWALTPLLSAHALYVHQRFSDFRSVLNLENGLVHGWSYRP